MVDCWVWMGQIEDEKARVGLKDSLNGMIKEIKTSTARKSVAVEVATWIGIDCGPDRAIVTQIGAKQPESNMESTDRLYSAYTAKEPANNNNNKGSGPRLMAAEEAPQAAKIDCECSPCSKIDATKRSALNSVEISASN